MNSAGLADLHGQRVCVRRFQCGTRSRWSGDRPCLGRVLVAGVTTCLPTIMTAVRDVILKQFQALDIGHLGKLSRPAMRPSYHLKGHNWIIKLVTY